MSAHPPVRVLRDAAEFIVREAEATASPWFSRHFENILASRAEGRIPIRIFRFCRSTLEALTSFGSGTPLTVFIAQPMRVAGL
jgi:hypothetical protein